MSDPPPARHHDEKSDILFENRQNCAAVGSHATWRMAVPLFAGPRNSHRNGERVFLIFVADPIPCGCPDLDRHAGVRIGAVDTCGVPATSVSSWSIFKFAVATESVVALLAMRRGTARHNLGHRQLTTARYIAAQHNSSPQQRCANVGHLLCCAQCCCNSGENSSARYGSDQPVTDTRQQV
jgi:hypothetical protein